MKKLSEKIIKYRQIVILSTILITIFFSLHIRNLKINPDVISYLPEDDPVAMAFDSIGKSYQGNMIAAIGYENDIFTNDALIEIKRLTDTLKYIPGISNVNSIINVIDIRNEDSVLQVLPLIDENSLPLPEKSLDSLKKYVLSKDIYSGFIISEDGSATVITVKLLSDWKEKIDTSIQSDNIIDHYKKRYPEPFFSIKVENKDSIEIKVERTAITKHIKEKLVSMNLKGKLYFGGLPFMITDIGDIISRDILFLGIIALIIILFILYVSFKNWRGVLLPVLSVGIAISWVLGLMGLLGFEITMVTNCTPVILLATGSAYAIHVINRIQLEYKTNNKPFKDILISSLTYISVPVFFASITTIIGFVSFIFGSYLVMISQFGLFTALGVLFSLILSITFIPALISYLPFKSTTKIHNIDNLSRFSVLGKFLDWIYSLTCEHKKYLISFWLLVLIVFTIGIFKIERRVDLLDYFKENYSSKQTEKFLRNKFGGTSYLYVNFIGDIQNISNLQLMEKIQNHIDSLPQVAHVLSVIDILKEMNYVMENKKILPDNQQKIYNLWFLLEGQETVKQLVTNNNTEGLIQAILNTSDSKAMSEIVEDLDNHFKNYKNVNCRFYQSGFPGIYKKLDESLINSQLYSLAIALLMVYIFVSILLKSLKSGVLTVIPIIITVVTLFGTMGWLGIPLDVATVLVASVTMGIGIDYSIHLISHYSHEISSGNKNGNALKNSITISGRAIIINVASVTLGFLVLIFSDLVPLQRFGFLIGVTMIVSGFSTLTLLSVLLNWKSKN